MLELLLLPKVSREVGAIGGSNMEQKDLAAWLEDRCIEFGGDSIMV